MRHEMSVMTQEGDSKIHWDSGNPESIAVAADAYRLYSDRGYKAFAMSNGTSGEQMSAFDPSVGCILFVPPLQGG